MSNSYTKILWLLIDTSERFEEVTEFVTMKKRILRDPETGEIVGATRAPFLKAKLESQFMEEKISEDNFSQDDEEDYAINEKSNLSKILGLLIAFVLGVIATQLFSYLSF